MQDAISKKLAYKGRISTESSKIIDLLDGDGEYTVLPSYSHMHIYTQNFFSRQAG